jgi:hypothetical protein
MDEHVRRRWAALAKRGPSGGEASRQSLRPPGFHAPPFVPGSLKCKAAHHVPKRTSPQRRTGSGGVAEGGDV